MARAREWEARLGTTINALIMTNRHLGRSFSLGGFHHPRSRYSEYTDDVQAPHGFNSVLDYWEEEITAKSISLFLNVRKEIAVIGVARGGPPRQPVRRLVGRGAALAQVADQ